MSHRIEAFHVRIRHFTHEEALSHVNEACHAWTSHVTYEQRVDCAQGNQAHEHASWRKWFVSHMIAPNHTWIGHGTRMNESCHTYKWVNKTHEHTTTCTWNMLETWHIRMWTHTDRNAQYTYTQLHTPPKKAHTQLHKLIHMYPSTLTNDLFTRLFRVSPHV